MASDEMPFENVDDDDGRTAFGSGELKIILRFQLNARQFSLQFL